MVQLQVLISNTMNVWVMILSMPFELKGGGSYSCHQPSLWSGTYFKAAEVYDDGSIKAKYYAEMIREDEGIRPP